MAQTPSLAATPTTTKTYDPAKVNMSFCGVNITGFAEGSFIKVVRDAELWKKNVGVQGEVSRTKRNNKSGTVTIRLMQTSDSNTYLNSVLVADEISNISIGPIMVKDNSGTSVFSAAESWIRKYPDGDYEADEKEREWIFDCASIDMGIGGN